MSSLSSKSKPTVFVVDAALRRSPCRACQAPVVWWENPRTGKPMPLDVQSQRPTLAANRVLMSSHFATCPAAAQWRHQ